MINFVLIALQVILAFVGVYQFVLALFGIVRKRRELKHAPQKSFAVLVAAHNESAVVGALIDNLKNLDYPKELYDVFVICDNCTDDTAEISRSKGVYAMERHNPHLRGKGHAIEWMLKELWAMPRQYDAVVMFDADNLCNADFLHHMNNDLCEGHQVIQAYLDTKNPDDSWVTASYGITYWYCNRLWQLSRRNLRMANFLGGTGMCFESDLLKEMGWGATSLVEDLEFSMRCVKRGVHPVLNFEAKVYDEKPLTFKASARQRLRWMQGHFTVARHYFFPLIWASIKERSFIKFDAALYSMSAYNTLLGFVLTAMIWIDSALPGSNAFISIYSYLPSWIAIVSLTLAALMFPLVMMLEGIKSGKMYAHLLSMIVFQLSWLPITFYAFFTQNNKQWSHTQHTRVLRLEEVQSKQAS
ncbi:cellulose synthase/poly-beta-1,6-N-acetylglucosamine synthase-like glycosyltransferase [Paenibacillus phyllosphaerae]|uniref:Cellulose synthase/poly-beta-1,6-N-acetylglucosamine synthase-like glycosyltransferase n=1 Tax=Paenibacillus phyllosphaerae TaxID=274593 RepID=A0A7W5FL03_9BACL|nr:glycosyltransferase family 2 protein [Paenibacillus phyllosphaerae]MBB3108700.1 cellulose synthase/poly-beta-1,6-N-acetylglucosamine synthase-like glycosyltransferase [Paenibacillus phyllosphaerae]